VGIGFPRGKNLQRVRIVNHPQGIFSPKFLLCQMLGALVISTACSSGEP
jgi:hypothetical protein